MAALSATADGGPGGSPAGSSCIEALTYSRELLLGHGSRQPSACEGTGSFAITTIHMRPEMETAEKTPTSRGSRSRGGGSSSVGINGDADDDAKGRPPPPGAPPPPQPLSGWSPKAGSLNADAPVFIPNQSMATPKAKPTTTTQAAATTTASGGLGSPLKVPVPQALGEDAKLELPANAVLGENGTSSTPSGGKSLRSSPTPLSLADTIAEPSEARTPGSLAAGATPSGAPPSPFTNRAGGPLTPMNSPMTPWPGLWPPTGTTPTGPGASPLLAHVNNAFGQLPQSQEATVPELPGAGGGGSSSTKAVPEQPELRRTKTEPAGGAAATAAADLAAASRYAFHLHRLLFSVVANKCQQQQLDALSPSSREKADLASLPEPQGMLVRDIKDEWSKVYGNDMQALMEKCGHKEASTLVHDVRGIKVIGAGEDMRVVATPKKDGDRDAEGGGDAPPTGEAAAKAAPLASLFAEATRHPQRPPGQAAAQAAEAATLRGGRPKVLSLDQFVESPLSGKGANTYTPLGGWAQPGGMFPGNPSPMGGFWGMPPDAQACSSPWGAGYSPSARSGFDPSWGASLKAQQPALKRAATNS